MLKSIDRFTAVTPSTGTGAYTCLNPCAQGYTNGTRIGDSIRMKSLEVRASIQPYPDTGEALCNQGRCCLFYDTQPNGAAPTDATLMQFTSAGTGYPEAFILSPINFSYRERYILLDDWRFSFNADMGGANIGVDRPKFYTKYLTCDLLASYNGNAGTYADIVLNSVWIMFAVNRSTSSGINVFINTRVTYTDK